MALIPLGLGYRLQEILRSVAQGLDRPTVGVDPALENLLCQHLKFLTSGTRLVHLRHVLQGLQNVHLHHDQVLEVRMVIMIQQGFRYRQRQRRLEQVSRERIHTDLPQVRVPRV